MKENRKEQLLKCFENVDKSALEVILPMIDNVIFLEMQLDELKKLPFVNINPRNPMQQKPTTASKMFKELHQQYNNSIKILISVLIKNGEDEESPLRGFMMSLKDKYYD